MANQYGFQLPVSYEAGVVEVFAKVAIGATGAPTITVAKGVKSVTRTGAGAYTVVLGQADDNFTGNGVSKYQRLLAAQATFIKSAAVPSAPIMSVVADNTSTDGDIDIAFFSDAGAATDPASGESLLLSLKLLNLSSDAGF